MRRSERSSGYQRQRQAVYFVAIAAILLAGWFAWRWLKPSRELAPQRDLTNLIAWWRCDRGHTFEAAGAYGVKHCPKCGAVAYLLARYRCREHGLIEATLRYERGPHGEQILAGLRFDHGPWQERPVKIVCPICGRALESLEANPFADRR